MKKWSLFLLIGSGLIVIFSGLYVYSFQNLLIHRQTETETQNQALLKEILSEMQYQATLITNYQQDALPSDVSESEAQATVLSNEYILPAAVYVLEIYDKSKDQLTKETLPIPGHMVGLTRVELLSYFDLYAKNLPIEEYLKGFISNEVLQFSKDNVTVRKTYDSTKPEFLYYICIKNNQIVIYYSDLKTVYEYTGISADVLSEEDQMTLQTGIYLRDIHDLYGLLESITS